MTDKINIPENVDRVLVQPLRYKKGRVEMHGDETDAHIRARGARNGAYMFAETSAANASRLLNAAGFRKVGRRSEWSGGWTWLRLSDEQAAALPRAESPRELIERWRGNPSPSWIDNYVRTFEDAIADLKQAAAKAYEDPKRYAPQFDNIKSDFFNIGALAGHGERRIAKDAERLAGYKVNPTADEDETKVERALDKLERARREAQKFEDKRREMFAAKHAIDPEFDALHRAAAAKHKKAIAAAKRARKKYAEAHGESAARSRGYVNPCGGAVANPAPLPRLALLGEVTELRIKSHGGARTLKARGMLLLASGDGRTIVVARPVKASRAEMPRDERGARRMFEKWSAYKARRAVRLTLPDKPITVDLGHVELIRYRSSKWTGKPTLYEHPFTHKNSAIADSYRAPRVIRIVADPPRVIVSERGIIG